MAQESYRFVVSGRVQGVYFRQSTANRAHEMGLSGWVRNLPDGRVEGLACGEPAALWSLREWLNHGPPAARVEAVEWRESRDLSEAGFEIRR